MNSSVKRRGRPNRGGGRFNGPPRGRGGGGRGGGTRHGGHNVASTTTAKVGGCAGRKGGSRAYDDDDMFDDEDDYVEEEEQLEESAEVVENVNVEKPSKVVKRKVDMQVLHMSDNSQAMVTSMLTELHGSGYKMKAAHSYKDTGRDQRRFWVHDRQLLVLGLDDQKVPDLTKNTFAQKKLESFGFHSSRCSEALSKCDGDVGLALERLMSDCFDLQLTEKKDDDDEAEISIVPSDTLLLTENKEEEETKEFLQQMEDENMALKSIYGTEGTFVERIPGKVWEMKLELAHILSKLNLNKELADDDTKNKICPFFLKGHCKFGKRCRMSHKEMKEDKHLLQREVEDFSFTMEIRFPSTPRVYPRDCPLVCFYCANKQFPPQKSLKITSRLMEEAVSLARDHVPCVFALVNLLDNVDEMEMIVDGPDVAFSFAPDLVPCCSNNSVTTIISDTVEKSSDEVTKRTTRELKLNVDKVKEDNEKIRKIFTKRKVAGEDAQIMQQRRSLPAWKEQENILEQCKNNQVVVISGMTGCGKSTQVPQYILDEWLTSSSKKLCNIVCTQPRRISAIGVAERVAFERNEKVGNVIGYQIRLESKMSSLTRLQFCTTGILLRRLESDHELQGVTHVIVDEVHERTEESDFLLMILRDLTQKRPDLRLILMSATLNAKLFCNYFQFKVPLIDIPGKAFHVEQIFLENLLHLTGYTLEEDSTYAKKRNYDNYDDQYDHQEEVKPPQDGQKDEVLNAKQIQWRYAESCPTDCATMRTISLMDHEKINYDLIEATLVHICGNYTNYGSILVFLPGMQEIMTLYDQLANHRVMGLRAGRFKLIPLHSSLSSEEQAAIFVPTKKNVRKIVLSTNLAETSITIDDCVYVIEVGRMKEKRFDSLKNMESLDTVWVSQANALQRKGRAGRTQKGFCFHLYTKFRYEHHLRKDPVPEIHRVPLEQMILRIKILFPQIQKSKTVLDNLIEPPHEASVIAALKRLMDVGAVDQAEDLTPLGFHLASLPVDVRIGKLLLLGAVFRCLDSVLTIAASLSYRSPFVSPFGKRTEATRKKQEFAVRNSDQLAALSAYNAWRSASRVSYKAGVNFVQENFLSGKTLSTLVSMKHQFVELLASIGFVAVVAPKRLLDRNARNGCDAVEAVTGKDLNGNCGNHKLIVSILCAALYPNIVQVLSPQIKYKQTASGAMLKPPDVTDLRFKTKQDGYVHIHPSSVNAKGVGRESAYLVYHEKIKTSRVFVRECSMVPLYSMVLFGGLGVQVELQRGQFVLSMEDGWIKFVTHSHTVAECLSEMRNELDNLLEQKIANPMLDLTTDARGKLIIDTIVKLITVE